MEMKAKLKLNSRLEPTCTLKLHLHSCKLVFSFYLVFVLLCLTSQTCVRGVFLMKPSWKGFLFPSCDNLGPHGGVGRWEDIWGPTQKKNTCLVQLQPKPLGPGSCVPGCLFRLWSWKMLRPPQYTYLQWPLLLWKVLKPVTVLFFPDMGRVVVSWELRISPRSDKDEKAVTSIFKDR